MHPRSRGASASGSCDDVQPSKSGGRREGRVSADTHGPRAAKKHAAEPQDQPNNRPSLRGWFTAYTRSPRGPTFLPPSLACPSRSTATLASAPGCQDHTTSPSASTTVRPTASMRPPHPALNVRDDAHAPPIEPGRADGNMISIKAKLDCFRGGVWTPDFALKAFTELAFPRDPSLCRKNDGEHGMNANHAK